MPTAKVEPEAIGEDTPLETAERPALKSRRTFKVTQEASKVPLALYKLLRQPAACCIIRVRPDGIHAPN